MPAPYAAGGRSSGGQYGFGYRDAQCCRWPVRDDTGGMRRRRSRASGFPGDFTATGATSSTSRTIPMAPRCSPTRCVRFGRPRRSWPCSRCSPIRTGAGIMARLAPVVSTFILTMAPTAPSSRAWQPANAVGYATAQGWSVELVPDFDRALSRAQSSGATVLLTGSFHTVGDAMARLQVSPVAG